MVKTKTAIAFDTFFITIICFLILYSWFYKILKNAFLSLFICNLISIYVYIAIFKAEIKKHKLKNIKNKELNFAKDCLKTIQYFSTSEEKTFFENLLNSTQIKSKIFENQNSLFYINLKQPLSSHDFFKAHALKTDAFLNKDLSFICESIDDSFKSKNENFSSPYTVYNFTDLFKLMKEKECFPTTDKESKKISIKNLIKKFSKSINRNNFKNFFLSGLSLLTISFFIPYSIHYLICGSTLLIFSALCIFKKSQPTNFNKPTLQEQIKK